MCFNALKIDRKLEAQSGQKCHGDSIEGDDLNPNLTYDRLPIFNKPTYALCNHL